MIDSRGDMCIACILSSALLEKLRRPCARGGRAGVCLFERFISVFSRFPSLFGRFISLFGFKTLAPRIGIGRQRFRRLSRIGFRCREPEAAERLKLTLALIEFEWRSAQVA
jgi:hypothetical protein